MQLNAKSISYLLPCNLMQNQYRINFQKREFNSKIYEHVLLLVFRNDKENKWIKKNYRRGFMFTRTMIATS